MTTLQGLVGEDPSFADAYDVLGRAQVETGNFAQAIETYRTASTLTPDLIIRLQKLGMGPRQAPATPGGVAAAAQSGAISHILW